MRAEDTVRYLQAAKNRDKVFGEVVDKILNDERVMTREEALRLLRNKPTPGAGKKHFIVAKIAFLVFAGMGMTAGFLYLNGGPLGYPLGISLVSLFIAWLFFLAGLIVERDARLSDEQYLKETLKDKYKMLEKRRKEDEWREHFDAFDPRNSNSVFYDD